SLVLFFFLLARRPPTPTRSLHDALPISRQGEPRKVLGATIVARSREERGGEPPPARLECRAVIAAEPFVAVTQLVRAQRRETGPAAPLGCGHVPQRGVERRVGAREVPGRVQRQAQERRTPPPVRAALARRPNRGAVAAGLDQVTHPLARDPLVPREACARVVERGQQRGPGVSDQLGFRGGMLGGLAVIVVPVTEAPDPQVARAARVARSIRQMLPPDRFFFSSRRRHTRCYRDWSSDVCSSD